MTVWEPLLSLSCGFCNYYSGRIPFIALHYVFSPLCFMEKKKFSVINKFSLKTWLIFVWWIYTIAVKSKRPHTVPYWGHHFHRCGRLLPSDWRCVPLQIENLDDIESKSPHYKAIAMQLYCRFSLFMWCRLPYFATCWWLLFGSNFLYCLSS